MSDKVEYSVVSLLGFLLYSIGLAIVEFDMILIYILVTYLIPYILFSGIIFLISEYLHSKNRFLSSLNFDNVFKLAIFLIFIIYFILLIVDGEFLRKYSWFSPVVLNGLFYSSILLSVGYSLRKN